MLWDKCAQLDIFGGGGSVEKTAWAISYVCGSNQLCSISMCQLIFVGDFWVNIPVEVLDRLQSCLC